MAERKRIKIDDLYFGIKRADFNTKKLVTTNLFGCRGVLLGVALYRLGKAGESGMRNPFDFIFCDTRGAFEYEYSIGEAFCEYEDLKKTDVYTMYAEPNKKYLMELINQVSVNSCREWYSNYRKQRYGK